MLKALKVKIFVYMSTCGTPNHTYVVIEFIVTKNV
jgi:hypothetical protein